VPKRNCTSRAEWRLQTGRSPESISAHYRLDCDFGTPVILLWQKGGSEPIYVCEGHSKQLGPSREHGPEVRILTAESEPTETPDLSEERSKPAEPVAVKPTVAVSAKPFPAPAASKPGLPVIAGPAGAAPKEPVSLNALQAPVAEKNASVFAAEAAETKPKESVSPKAAQAPPPAKTIRTTSDAPTRSRFRDLTFGDSAKAMVDEAIWNLATGDFEAYRTALRQGKSDKEAAHAAGGQLAVIHQKAGEYAFKLEELLSGSKATVSVAETVDKPLEQSMLELISNEAINDAEQDAAIQRLGAAQEWVKHGLQGEMTLPQANRILLAIGERLNWGGACDVAEECRPVYRTLYANLRTAIRAAVPEAQNFQDRLTNLYAAKSELDKQLQPAKELSQASR
jgi:hypothetical protein